MDKPLLHLVFGGRVADPRGTDFLDVDTLHVVGIYPSYASALDAWREVSRRCIDYADIKYVIVHLHRFRDGSRRVTQVTEVVGMEGDVVTLSDIFQVDYSAGFGPDGRFRGELRPTGIRPGFSDRLHDLGIGLPPGLFGGDVFATGTGW